MNIESEGKILIRNKEDYIYQLENLIKYDLNSISDSDFILEAQNYIVYKIKELTEDNEKITDFIKQVNELIELAIDVDSEVATLYQTNELQLPASTVITEKGGIKDVLIFLLKLQYLPVSLVIQLFNNDLYVDLKARLRYWYECEGGKELINVWKQKALYGIACVGAIVVGVAILGALAASNPITFVLVAGAILATIGIANGYVGTKNAELAYQYAREGNPALSRVVGARTTFSDELRATNFNSRLLNTLSYGVAYTIDGVELALSIYCIGHDFKVVDRAKTLINFVKNKSKNLTFGKVVSGVTNLPKKAVNVCSSIKSFYKNKNTISGILYNKASTKVISSLNRLESKVNRTIQTGKHTLQTFGTAWGQFKVDLNPRVAFQFANIPGGQYNIFDRQKVIKDATYNFINTIKNIGKNLDNVDGVLDGSRVVNALDDMDNVNLGQVGEGGRNSRLFKDGYDNHLISGTMGKGQKGVIGGHNFEEFKKVLSDASYDVDDCIININKHPSIDGICEIEYRIPARTYGPDGDLVIIPNQFKTIAYPKTVYDPAIISDEQMIQWGREAMESGIVNGREIMGNASNGLKFKGYIDETTGEISNFYPVLEE